MIGRLAACLAAALLLIQPAETPRQRLERAYRLSNRGVALLEQYDYPSAATAFRDALAIEPSLGHAHLGLAIALLYAGQGEAALPEARAAAAALPSAPQPSFVIGLIGRSLNQADVAEPAFRRVLEIDPADAASEVNLGQLLMAKRQFPDALAAFRAAAAAEPYNATAAYGLATALTRSGDPAAGQQQMTKFQTLRDSPYAVTYSQSYLQQGRYGEAISSSGAEPDLVDRATPPVTFVEAAGLAIETRLPPIASALPRDLHPAVATWVDVDHDGDLDLVTAAPIRLLRNNGNGSFTDITREAGLAVPDGDLSAPAAIVPTDFDNRRDVDLLILSGGTLRLYRNMRDGTFQDVAAAVGLPQSGVTAVAAADVNKDGFIDFYLGRAAGAGTFALSDGRLHFTLRDAPAATSGSRLAQFFDYDNDGLLDLLVATADGLRLLRNVGDGWSDETAHTGLDKVTGAIRSLALGDADHDGDVDILVTTDRGTRGLRNDGGNRHPALAVTLAPHVSNPSALGAKVEIRAGSLRQMLETSAASPAVGPSDLLFGLGDRSPADVVRVLWPSGILQTELAPASPTRPFSPLNIVELDRKPSSCPYLYTWNGSRFEFMTDFLGGGEMGDWEGPGRFNTPDPDEYVRIPGDRLVGRDGRYEIRITNELEEAMFLDRVRLLAVDHPSDVDVYPNEGLMDPPRPPFHLYATRGAHAPLSAVDEHGHDVRALVAQRDRRWPDDFGVEKIRGYAKPHTLTLDLGKDADRAVLLLTGWTAYAFSADNLAASQAGLMLHPPSVDVRDAAGQWKTIDANIGFPVGRPQTVPVDLAGRWLGPSREVRISTNMPIYWDQILVDTSGGGLPYAITAIDPGTAVLHWRGFSAEESPDGREPFGANYDRVSATSPWKGFPGAYTREGDVRALLTKADDMFVIAKPGDEIALSFPVSGAPPLRAGWKRTFLLHADGFSKEMNIWSATPDELGPLPFHAMSRYPYGSGEHYPRDAAHGIYLAHYNTRLVSRVVPSIDAISGEK
jgi:Tfp pilus assembly protein PilF